MPTEQARRDRAKSIRQNRAIIAMIAGFILLSFVVSGRIYSITNDLKSTQTALGATQRQLGATQALLASQQMAACVLRRAGRADANKHERVPLKAALNYLGTLGDQGLVKATDPAQKAALQAFASRFHGYSNAVQPLPNPEC